MIQHPNKNYIDPIEIEIKDQHAHCFHANKEPDGKPWYHDIKKFLATQKYLENATNGQNRVLRRLANHCFVNEKILYKRNPDLDLLRCVDAAKDFRLLEEIHAGKCGPYMNGFTLAKKILRVRYFWMTMDSDNILYIQKCHQCQIHRNFIRVPPNQLNVEASTYKAVIKKVVVDFVPNNIVCKFGMPESTIIDNATNLNSDLTREICEKFGIVHRNSTAYIPQMNGVVEAANKNIKRQWHEKLPFALLGYRTTMRTSIWATPYMLVYGTEAVMRTEVEIPSLRVIEEANMDDAEWIRIRKEHLMLIDEKRMDVVCHSELYQNRIASAFNKRVKPGQFSLGQLVLKKIFPHNEEAKGKLALNKQGPYMYMVPRKKARTSQGANATPGVAVDSIPDDMGEHPRGDDISPTTTLPDSTTPAQNPPIPIPTQGSTIPPTNILVPPPAPAPGPGVSEGNLMGAIHMLA
ncbi:uncharacterized protein LOC142169776 [Nicotiana tabacum]|uniref:Uncharacterized protein LOC142169776 n=1 Tax=Nicotiana tabacum TaxID=4097 RepID=A0AC58SS25_TOBAC